MGRYRVNRNDNGSKALQAYADSIGFVRHSDGGAIDDYLAIGMKIAAVEYKSKGGTLTPSQQRIIAKGFPVRFVSTTQQLDELKREMTT